MSEKDNKTTSDFLKNLQEAVNSGDATKGKASIDRINDIHKLAETMDSKTAGENFNKRLEDVGEREPLTQEEVERVTLENEKIKIRREKEDVKLRMLSDIHNAEINIEEVKKEFDEVKLQYEAVIRAQEDELKVLKIKYEARFGEVEDEG